MAYPSPKKLQYYFQQDPFLFPEQVLGLKFWDKQRDIIQAIHEHERVVVPSAHHCSKSHTAGALTLGFLFTYTPSIVISTSAQKEQVKNVIWREIHTQWRNAKVPLSDPRTMLQLKMHLGSDWFAIGLRPQDTRTEAFQGHHSPHVLIIFDEASGIPGPIWEAAEGLMTSTHVRFLAMGQPFDPLSHFGEACDNEDVWHKIQISAYDTPNVKAGKNVRPELMSFDWPDKKKREWGEDSVLFQVRCLGMFPDHSDEKVISLPLAMEVADRAPVDYPNEQAIIGLDSSGLGRDKNVWVIRRGMSILGIKWSTTESDESLAERTSKLFYQYKAKMVNIDGVTGKAVYENLRKRGIPTNLIFMSANAREHKEYYNLRAECAFMLRKSMEQGLCLAGGARTYKDFWIRDVTAPKYDIDDRTGRKKLEDKRKLVKRLKRSTDFLDATLLTFAKEGQLPLVMIDSVPFLSHENKDSDGVQPYPTIQGSMIRRPRTPGFFFTRLIQGRKERGLFH